MRVDQVDGVLDGFPAVVAFEQRLVDFGVVVAGEADVADHALFLGFDEGFERAAGGEDLFDLVHAGDFVAGPEVEIVGVHALQRQFQLGHGRFLVAQLGLGHEEDVFTGRLIDGLAVSYIAFAVVILGGGIEHDYAEFDGAADDFDPFLFAANA